MENNLSSPINESQNEVELKPPTPPSENVVNYLEQFAWFPYANPIFISSFCIIGTLLRIACSELDFFGPIGEGWFFANIIGSFFMGVLVQLKNDKAIQLE